MPLVYRTRQRQNPYNVNANNFVIVPPPRLPLRRQLAFGYINRPQPTPTGIIMRQATNAARKIQTKQRQKVATKKVKAKRVAKSASNRVKAKSLRLPNNVTERILYYQTRPGQRRTTIKPLYRNTSRQLQNMKRIRALQKMPLNLQHQILSYL